MLFDTGRQAGASFALFDEAKSDLYFTIKNKLTGGPSIIFNIFTLATISPDGVRRS